MRAPHTATRLRGRLLQRLTIRRVLLLGFGLTLVLWVFSGYYFASHVAEVRQQSEQISRRYMRAQELLSTVRTQVLIAAVYVRDGLLDPSPSETVHYRNQLEEVMRRVNSALDRYEPVFGLDFDPHAIAQLRHQIDDFRRTVIDVLATHDARRPRDAREILRARIMPRREAVIRVSEEVQALNRAAFVRQQEATAEVYGAMQRRTLTQFGLALAISFLIGLVATHHVARLEGRLRRQQLRDQETSRDLQRLSAQLINAQEEERRTIARELHDEVGQVLTAVRVELAVAEHRIEAAGMKAAVLADARAITDNALHTVRDLSHLLHPALLDDMGLLAATEARIREFRRRHRISIDLVQQNMDARLPAPVELAAYRVVQEALTNVVRHSQARSCQVQLRRVHDALFVAVRDDGVGFDASACPCGLGLIGMRERAAQLGGSVHTITGLGLGTTIEMTIPVDPPATTAVPAAVPPPAAGAGHPLRQRVPLVEVVDA
ncbi:MAG: sensor histidine kinase [Vicinamibacterales bacterium]